MYSLQFWLPVLVTVALNAMVALGVYVTLLSGQASVAHAAFMGIGGYTGGLITTNLGLPLPAAIAAGVAVAAAVGALLSVATLRMSELVVAITTIGFGEIMVVLALNWPFIGGANGLTGIPLLTPDWLIFASLAACVYLAWRLDRSRLGMAARALRDDRVVAGAVGVNIPAIRVVTFAIGAGMAGLAGVLKAGYVTIVSPEDLSFFNSFYFKMFVLFGGSYVFTGPVVGALALTILPELLQPLLNLESASASAVRFMCLGAAVVIVLRLRRGGLLARTPIGESPPALRLLQHTGRRLRAVRRA